MTLQLPLETRCPVPFPVEIVAELGEPVRLVETVGPFLPLPLRRTYDPLARRSPKLWEALAQLAADPAPQACAAFASAWGFLTRPVDGWAPAIGRGPLRAAQDLARWRDARVLPPFGAAVALFEVLTTGRWERLQAHGIQRDRQRDGTDRYVFHAAVWGTRYNVETPHPTHKTVGARALIADLAAPALRRAGLAWDWKRGVYGIAQEPLACAWVQLLQDVTGLDGGNCENCGRWILWDRRNRRGKRFCGNTCTVAAHRKRRAR
jgi:hypothetical protein